MSEFNDLEAYEDELYNENLSDTDSDLQDILYGQAHYASKLDTDEISREENEERSTSNTEVFPELALSGTWNHILGSDISTKKTEKKQLIQAVVGEDSEVWNIDDADLGKLAGQKYKKRYYLDERSNLPNIFCYNCDKKGHFARDCSEATKVPNCYLCGQAGHNRYKCENDLCYNCMEIGHISKDCQKPKSKFMHYKTCARCKYKGHVLQNCAEVWRQYHVTTVPDTIVKPDHPYDENRNRYCYNCASKRHFGEDCTSERISRRPIYSQFIVNYGKCCSKQENEKNKKNKSKKLNKENSEEKSDTKNNEKKSKEENLEERPNIIKNEKRTDKKGVNEKHLSNENDENNEHESKRKKNISVKETKKKDKQVEDIETHLSNKCNKNKIKSNDKSEYEKPTKDKNEKDSKKEKTFIVIDEWMVSDTVNSAKNETRFSICKDLCVDDYTKKETMKKVGKIQSLKRKFSADNEKPPNKRKKLNTNIEPALLHNDVKESSSKKKPVMETIKSLFRKDDKTSSVTNALMNGTSHSHLFHENVDFVPVKKTSEDDLEYIKETKRKMKRTTRKEKRKQKKLLKKQQQSQPQIDLDYVTLDSLQKILHDSDEDYDQCDLQTRENSARSSPEINLNSNIRYNARSPDVIDFADNENDHNIVSQHDMHSHPEEIDYTQYDPNATNQEDLSIYGIINPTCTSMADIRVVDSSGDTRRIIANKKSGRNGSNNNGKNRWWEEINKFSRKAKYSNSDFNQKKRKNYQKQPSKNKHLSPHHNDKKKAKNRITRGFNFNHI